MKRINGENFDQLVNQEKGLFVIKFFSPTCGPCKTMDPVFKALNENNSDVNVYEIDTMESPELAAHFGVKGVPYVTFCENREVLYSFTGVTPLADLQFVVDNINDAYFRTHGEFRKEEGAQSKKFEVFVLLLILTFVLLFIFL
jgi:thioredoxin 1